MYNIHYAKSVKKDLSNIDRNYLEKIKTAIESPAEFPNVSNIKKLSAHPLADYRLRVGEYRILFDISPEEKTIFILEIGHRKEVY